MLLGNHLSEAARNSNGGVKEVRLKNLRALAAAKSWAPADFVREVGKSPSYWSDLLRGAKGFGESVAREIEDKLGLPRTWLDQDHERGEQPPMPQQVGLGAALTEVARALSKLSSLDRRQIGAVLPLLTEAPETRQATCAAIMRLMDPGSNYEYSQTWEETAREVMSIWDQKSLTGREFLEKIDAAHGEHVKLRVAPTKQRKAG